MGAYHEGRAAGFAAGLAAKAAEVQRLREENRALQARIDAALADALDDNLSGTLRALRGEAS